MAGSSLSSQSKRPEKSKRKNGALSVVKSEARGKKRKLAPKRSAQIRSLQFDLASTKAYLQSVIEQLEDNSEELRSFNEELQNSMEELATANEELQSTNEQLRSVNAELGNRNEELNVANDDILNLFNSLTLNVVILDRGLCVRRLTPAVEKLLNLSPADMGRPFSDTNASQEISSLGNMIKEAVKTGCMQQMEIQGRLGQWFSLQVRPYMTADNRIDGAVLALLDVPELGRRTEELTRTNVKLQEQLLLRKQAEEKFRILFESAPEAVVISDSSGTVVMANAKTEQVFGYRRDELIGNPVEVLVPEGFRSQDTSYRDGYAAEPTARPIGRGASLTGRRKDGSEFPAEVRLNPIHTHAGLLISSSIVDISDRLRLAQQAQDAAVLEERNRLARDVHDTLAQGFVGILLQLEAAGDAINQLPEEARARLSSVSLLARANLEEARRSVAVLRPETRNDGDLVNSLENFVNTVRTGRKAKIEFSCKGAPRPLSSEIEENLLRMAQEGLNNALKHSNASTICVELLFAPSEIQLHVSDDGMGFSPNGTNKKGFGLTSLRERARQIGARLEIESAPGKGTGIKASVPSQFPTAHSERPK